MIRRSLICLLTLGLVACATQPKAPPSPPQASAPPPAPRPAPPAEAAPEVVQAPPVDLTPVPFEVARANFVRDTAAKYGMEPAQIEATLAQAQFKDAIVAAMSRPAERVKPWSEYRPMFISQARIDGGRAFLTTHRDELQRVQARTGVPAEVIVAIIGVETSYGKNAGSYRVLDALYTLAFRYPRSGDPAKLEREVRRELFFRDELGQLFALGREENLDITTLIGSYAGAMGLGQFMPSSYRQFAVDGDGDGKRNLFSDYDDAFSSIANYFVKKGGWVRDGVVAVPATLRPGAEEFNPSDWTPTYTLADLAARGYTPTAPVPATAGGATPITLDGSAGKQYWLGFQNYYAITRYNNSKMYAMAVYQLSQAIAGKELPPA
ncbi:lytic murein transglycosylase B [Xanthomonas rydalmerensis]|uniref:Lytic murein transglycosylase B n=1 Tax=Xanthomonas rydalmerensis TaxID=3046274 RepID=A0ABZ0JPD0_9XANT|nr:lytic murein transglycosylase B [Xanthomonas sp. DM-2023]WOS41635.1 lytic murein transglycosylase B [Xanthomonas sp. DM-2023]WOS45821.1 lytic murein transglycosylase B [Xanthomonas sp. DM-2023]WOS50000.1 lytic murein transglycosylase B [Xanthomonas sp. DM-2023]WOS54179.1 lytic murein transglycosylase B [Xanthomonas sp. DM-2023]WOS58362.1 lytic murein transglycosylase B [Xanthomonas sp. DM-2023]